MLTGYELFFAILAIAASSVVIGTVGFGFALVAAPVLLLYLEPQQVVVVINSLICLMLAQVLVRNWRHLELRPSMGLAISHLDDGVSAGGGGSAGRSYPRGAA